MVGLRTLKIIEAISVIKQEMQLVDPNENGSEIEEIWCDAKSYLEALEQYLAVNYTNPLPSPRV